MNSRSRILPVVGPAAVLYLLAGASAAGGLEGVRTPLGLLALALSLTPLFLRHVDAAGARRVSGVGVLAGIILAAFLLPDPASPLRLVAHSLAMPLAGARVFQLALVVPDRPGGLLRLAPLATVLALACALLGLLGAFPPSQLSDEGYLLPEAALRGAPRLFMWGAFTAALVLRAGRRRLGSGPAALASNAWGVMGLVVVVVALPLTSWLLGVGVLVPDPAAEALTAAVLSIVLLYGHVAMVDPRRRVYAGAAVRRIVRAVLAVGFVTVCFALARYALGSSDPAPAWAWAVAAGLTLAVDRALAPLVRRAIAPYGGRFLDALALAGRRLDAVPTLTELGAAVLPALREAAGESDAQPVLYVLEPARVVTIDAAGMPRVQAASLSTRLIDFAFDNPGTLTLVPELEAQSVRRPELRPLLDALAQHDALAILPLANDGHVDGLLVIPRGRRRSALALEEIHAAEAFARRLASQLGAMAGQLRAQARVGQLIQAHEQVLDELHERDLRVARLRGSLELLQAGGRAGGAELPRVAYSPAMRACEGQLTTLAPGLEPLCLLAPTGAPLLHLVELLHREGSRAEGPLVVVDCASVADSETLVALMGDPETGDPGWVAHAAEGTLVLRDVPALSMAAQEALALFMAPPAAVDGASPDEPTGAASALPPRADNAARVVLVTRTPLDELVARGTLAAPLGRMVGERVVAVPPLARRAADVPSLTLLAVASACRRLGRELLGVSQAVVDYLVRAQLDGDVRELAERVEEAVARAGGPQLLLADFRVGVESGAAERPPSESAVALPPEAEVGAGDEWVGTFNDLERKILERAMTRAGGNKSEAARTLGLKRTTFLDKLRRYGVSTD
ncbi:MAG: sigma 54-interacting transcriptional regulator [Sandaracinaceae bacterium]|nr:sigma 54-interacting transcriptional regulator [Sandaracinaceae bacterium]MBK7154902.1 sigma 54-interacting transcriptional regulator [Sandaracinaceae bacterium]MBK7772960.1 sigma 54-interacting transcriptional regulator [Sandaracinaceae bacterium]MBK8588752.1 sigma 54-interacting transcriptional regulator [Sandaracinaceae bacterium]MBP7681201.1 sigma 54-interacting transcriptional regulator [Deltaproteobacteria bacterium]